MKHNRIKLILIIVGTIFIFTHCTKEEELPRLPENVTIQIISKSVSTKSVVLNATQANSGLKGLWTIEDGDNSKASFSNVSDPLATFIGDIFDIYTIRWTISNGKESRYAEIEFKIADGFTIKEMLNAGITVEQLLQQGVAVIDLLSAGTSVKDLISANVSVLDLLNANAEISEILNAGITAEQLLQEGVTVSELLRAGASISELLEANVSVKDLLDANVGITNLMHAGVAIQDLLENGVSVRELLLIGISVSSLIDAGVTVDLLVQANVSIGDLLNSGVALRELLDLNISIPAFLNANVSVSDLLENGVTALALFNAGILVGELRYNGVSETILASYGLVGTLTDVQGNVYSWVKIGNQVWMAENLKTLKYSNGNDIIGVTFNGNEANVTVYGRQYTWAAAMNNSQSSSSNPSNIHGACPTDWHLPSDSEWKELIEYVGVDAGGKMKTIGTIQNGNGLWQADDAGSDGTNTTGFNGVPGGASNQWFGERAFFWTSTEQSVSTAWRPELIYHTRGIGYSYASKTATLSIRCIKD